MEENKTPQGSNNVENALSWIEKLSNMIKKAGLQNIILTIMVLFLVIVVGQVAFNPEAIIKRVDEIHAKQHTESIEKRIKSTPKITEALTDLKECLNADRVFILEAHNGGANLSNLPFLYVDLTYMEPKRELSFFEDEYKNTRLSRYPWASILYEETYWGGDGESMIKSDPELYYHLEKEGVKYMAAIVMYGTYNPTGVLGVVYLKNERPTEEYIHKIMVKYGAIISGLLNNDE